MSLRRAVAAPFATEGTDRMGESEFVVALSLDRDWFSPDQAKRLVDVAASEGLLDRDGEDLVAGFDVGTVTVPEDFAPADDVLRRRSTFERVLDAIVETGVAKQEAVAGINALQDDLAVTLEAAAVVYARRRDVDVSDLAAAARSDL